MISRALVLKVWDWGALDEQDKNTNQGEDYDQCQHQRLCGREGKNLEKDVKTITALINVYRRSLNQATIPISTKSSTDLEISYDGLVKDVKRICADAGNVTEYGAVDWDNLDSAIKDVTVDLRFRGDYTRASRKNIQKSIADNDLKEFKKQLKDSTKWPGVPQDRFDRRVKFLGN